MKKLLFALALILVGISARAQFYAGGTLGLDVVNVHNDGGGSATQTTFAITPDLGYSFDKTWSLGGQINFHVLSNNGSLTSITVMPYVRGVFARAGIVDFFGELGLGYGHQSYEGDGVSGVVAALRPGLAINFNPRFALIARSNLLQYEYWDGTSGLDFSINKGLDFGVQFKF